jgi:hypothetical protein
MGWRVLALEEVNNGMRLSWHREALRGGPRIVSKQKVLRLMPRAPNIRRKRAVFAQDDRTIGNALNVAGLWSGVRGVDFEEPTLAREDRAREGGAPSLTTVLKSYFGPKDSN